MLTLNIVGCGSLGATTAIEVAKRSLALDFEVKINLIDFDKVESRNCVAQPFHPNDIGQYKVHTIDQIVSQYKTVNCKVIPERLTKDNTKLLEINDETIIVDCVDNIETRELLWMQGMLNQSVPVLHSSMSEQGMGYVSWNFNAGDINIDTWPLSPKNISPSVREEVYKKKEKKIVPPCELNAMRTLILNTSLATVNAIFILAGKDSSNIIGGDTFGILTNWATDIYNMRELKELRGKTFGE